MIYLDYAASTPVDPQVAEKMAQFLTLGGHFANAASKHLLGKNAQSAIDEARFETANLIGAQADEIIFTSGATESNNLAIKGVVNLYHQRRGKHIITMKTEHKAVLDVCQHLEKIGFQVTYLAPEKNGLLNIEKLTAAIRADTVLMSIMHVNNETGVIQDLASVSEVSTKNRILLHVDAAQSAGKLPLDVKTMPIDLLSLSAHKMYGPKGIGALYLRKKPRVRVEPLIHGGGHEQGMRSGTLPTHQIVGLGEACRLAKKNLADEYKRILQYKKSFIEKLLQLPNVSINGDIHFSSPYILNVKFNGMIADAILDALPNIAASTASACQGKGTEGSYVLRAMGLTDEETKSSIRFSFGRFNTLDEIRLAQEKILSIFN